MRAGYRVTSPDEVGLHGADLVQISVYRGWKDNPERVRLCADACRRLGMPYVVHPVSYPLLDEAALGELREIALNPGEALILHDERGPGGARLSVQEDAAFRRAVQELSSMALLSFENAVNSADAIWFWGAYAGSITLDIGHLESAGMDSRGFVLGLDDALVGRIDYVHMHRNGPLRGGLTDHWPLEEGCPELGALEELLRRNPGVCAILEINETEETGRSLGLLRDAAMRAAR